MSGLVQAALRAGRATPGAGAEKIRHIKICFGENNYIDLDKKEQCGNNFL